MKFREEFLPRLRQLQARPVVQNGPVMGTLPMGALDPYLAFEQRNVGKSLAEELETFHGQRPSDLCPCIGLLFLKRIRRDSVDSAPI